MKASIKKFNESSFTALKREITVQLVLVGFSIVTSVLFSSLIFIIE